jgi:putative MATE family efflux protein
MSTSVIMLLITVFMGINISTGALVARAVGARDADRACRVADQSLALTFIFSIVVGALGYVASPAVLRWLGARDEVVLLGTGYLQVTFAGLFFMCAAFVLSGVLHGAGDAMTPFYLGVLSTVFNLALNPIFIFGWLGLPAMGVSGAALATVIARIISLAYGMRMLLGGRLPVRLSVRGMRPDPGVMWRILSIGVPSSVQMVLRTLMDLALMSIVASFGTKTVAAYTIGMRIRMIGLFPSFSFGQSSAAMVGQNLGAGRPDRARRSAWTAVLMALAVSAASAAAFAVFARPIVAAFDTSPAVVEAGAYMLRVTAVGLATAAVGIVLSRSLAGAGDTISPLIVTLLVLWGFQIPAAGYLSGVGAIWGIRLPFARLFEPVCLHGVGGVWYAITIASVFHALVLMPWFSLGRWQRKRL